MTPDSTLSIDDLTHNWNQAKSLGAVQVLDDTLRDGLQSPSATLPTLEQRQSLLRLACKSGVSASILGFAKNGGENISTIVELVRTLVSHHRHIEPVTAARTHPDDIAAHKEICQRSGVAVTAALFVGCSPIRAFVEGWNQKELEERVERSVSSCVSEGIPVLFVTEDTTRSKPEDIKRIYSAAISAGAQRICIADTVGYADPSGAKALVEYVRSIIEDLGAEVEIDWHGHNDRGFALINALVAAEHGATRIHATCLGMGERTGNTSLEQLVTYLSMEGALDPTCLREIKTYCEAVSTHCGAPFPDNLPIVGRDAFRTSSGIHAAAIIKAMTVGNTALSDKVYSAIPASLLGVEQNIEVGPMSGKSNIYFWLQKNLPNLPEAKNDELCDFLIAHAHKSGRVLSDKELLKIIDEHIQPSPAAQLTS